jgi:mannose-6-phosphate isomerase-like protein (cupin superfamily)
VVIDPRSEAPFGASARLQCIVTRGRARLTLGTSTRALAPGDAALVPAGANCRVANSGSEPLEMLLVQVGG